MGYHGRWSFSLGVHQSEGIPEGPIMSYFSHDQDSTIKNIKEMGLKIVREYDKNNFSLETPVRAFNQCISMVESLLRNREIMSFSFREKEKENPRFAPKLIKLNDINYFIINQFYSCLRTLYIQDNLNPFPLLSWK